MNAKFLDFIEKYKSQTVALAVSGGVDSVALLYWYAAAGLPCVALTVDHGLRADSAVEAAAVKKMAADLGISHETLHWTGEKPGTGLEAAARKARYDLMLDWCRKNNIGVLMTAHQADDQIETFLMHLGRGSGVYGLGGIRAETERDGVIIARPLLHVFRAELKPWCDSHSVKYFQDEMNEDENFMRVRIRKNRHGLQGKLDISDERILLAVENLGRAREAMEFALSSQFSVLSSDDDGRAIFPAAGLFSLPRELQLKFLSEALRRVAGAEYSPRLCEIERLLEKLGDDTIATLGNCAVRRLRDKILVAREGESVSFIKRRKNAEAKNKRKN
ncbi:MAG: tRNA lysidine(34) synthetase TilS [Alphaproteobacteria bacterium]|nr:tRNA lysidine(34) synthetase TilS [Alphaproteobacteria bacterium]